MEKIKNFFDDNKKEIDKKETKETNEIIIKENFKIINIFERILNNFFKKNFKKQEDENYENDYYINLEKEIEEYKNKDSFCNVLEKMILEYYQPILKFILDNYKKIKDNYYDVLIGDDIKGRIPTLILREILNYYRKQANLSNIDVKFVNGGKSYLWDFFPEKFKNIVNHLEKLKLKEKKILLVTEFVLSGEGFLRFVNVFKYLELDFDCFVAFSHFDKNFYLIKSKGLLKKNNFFIGQKNKYMPDTCLNYIALGLNKVGQEMNALAKKDDDVNAFYISFTRKKIKYLAFKIIKKIEKL